MEPLHHECGIVMVRLRKPLEYYAEKYGTCLYGLNKLYLLMEKQHNRGQDGAGLAAVKLHAPAGEEYLYRERAEGSNAITEIFNSVHHAIANHTPEELANRTLVEKIIPYVGESYMGHLRYSTTGKHGLSFIHPMIRRSNWRAKCLAVCGNFNLTNVEGVFQEITSIGQHPRITSDTHILLEQIGHRLDREVERLYRKAEELGLKGMDITSYIEAQINPANFLKRTAPLWDGGFVMCGLTGSGSSFVLRDRHGIRPAFYYADDEIIVAASERPVIQTVLNVLAQQVQELRPGQALLVDQKGDFSLEQILDPGPYKACSFERIYFSRGSDQDIYEERKQLGYRLTPAILQAIDYDIAHTVFAYIPNTAEVAYFGMIQGLKEYLNQHKAEQIAALKQPVSLEEIEEILSLEVRAEKVAIKDIKLRTFIAEGNSRNDLAAHVYDVTYGILKPQEDNLVIIDDSIVRGTTLRQSILSILGRLQPKKIVVVSSSPQIRYPDCYGIDMRKIGDFIAFRAAIALLKERNLLHLVDEAYRLAVQYGDAPKDHFVPNVVKSLYEPFSDAEVAHMIARLLKPAELQAEVTIIFQSIDGLHQAIPNHLGDWYFSGDYPTPGGSHIVNQSFIEFYEQEFAASSITNK